MQTKNLEKMTRGRHGGCGTGSMGLRGRGSVPWQDWNAHTPRGDEPKIPIIPVARDPCGGSCPRAATHWAEWPKIVPTIKLIRVNSSWDAPNWFSGTAWARVTNVEGVKPQDWPVKKCRTYQNRRQRPDLGPCGRGVRGFKQRDGACVPRGSIGTGDSSRGG